MSERLHIRDCSPGRMRKTQAGGKVPNRWCPGASCCTAAGGIGSGRKELRTPRRWQRRDPPLPEFTRQPGNWNCPRASRRWWCGRALCRAWALLYWPDGRSNLRLRRLGRCNGLGYDPGSRCDCPGDEEGRPGQARLRCGQNRRTPHKQGEQA
jgi:hypothetical protein